MYQRVAAVAIAAMSLLSACPGLPASAATPVSVEAAAQFPLAESARKAGGTTQSAFALDYDFGPQTIVPIRASFHLEDSNGSRGSGRINAFGAGVAARLTTPIYAGAGLSLVTINAAPDMPNAVVTNVTGIGTNLFVGERLFSLPGGTGVALQATYRRLPHAGNVDPSAFALGLRVQL
ncbi:MAG: hypothetical protein NVS3B16_06490 [Vulcanimicrobiaceae bacterium]